MMDGNLWRLHRRARPPPLTAFWATVGAGAEIVAATPTTARLESRQPAFDPPSANRQECEGSSDDDLKGKRPEGFSTDFSEYVQRRKPEIANRVGDSQSRKQGKDRPPLVASAVQEPS
jgi:hypothetical protein